MHEAGASHMLMPGFDVVASSHDRAVGVATGGDWLLRVSGFLAEKGEADKINIMMGSFSNENCQSFRLFIMILLMEAWNIVDVNLFHVDLFKS